MFVLPSLLTTANIFCGFYSIMESLAGAKSLAMSILTNGAEFVYRPTELTLAGATEHFDRAAIAIGFATLFDLLDGRVARMTNATSEFGLELDSIADVVSFGVAPAVLAFSWGYGQVPGLSRIGWIASFLFVICGALRLARFNVQARRPAPNLPPKNPKVDKKAFVGMPIPLAAAMIASIAHFAPTPVSQLAGTRLWNLTLDVRFLAGALLALVFSLSLLMVSTVRYPSFKNVGVKRRNPRLIVLAIALLVTIIWFNSQYALLVIATLYASWGVVAKLWSMIRPRHASHELDATPRSELSG